MEPLTRREEEILRVLFRLQRAFVKDIIAALPGKKPAYTTVSTIVRKLEDKGYVDHEDFGPTYRYYPKVARAEFRRRDLKRVVSEYFDDSHKALVSHFALNKKISKADLEEILRMIEEE